MGLEGAVRLGFRRELAAVVDPDERQQLFDRLVALAYERGQALEVASVFEIDDVIDPASTRSMIVDMLRAAGKPPPRTGKKRTCIETW
jgi:acetyl-CoA carboxylase carboxyltransferase component